MTDATPQPTPESTEGPALPTGQALPVAAEEPPVPAETPIAPVAPVIPPVNVTVVAPSPPTLVAKSEGVTLAPNTTEAQDKISEGQRRINIVWEATQAVIALTITFAIVYLAIVQTPAETITNAFFLIVGFYFSRTAQTANGTHGAPGGKPGEPPMGG